MSRFNTRGLNKCEDCQHYRKSERCPTYRCDDPDNTYQGRYGTAYIKHPDSKNWNYKCNKYKQASNSTRGSIGE